MKPNELKSIRARLGLSALKFGRALGIGGMDSSVRSYVSQMETGKEEIPERTARLARMFHLHGIPDEFK